MKTLTQDIRFRISSAGIAGDPHQLVVGVRSDGTQIGELYRSSNIFNWMTTMSLARAKKLILNQFMTLADEARKEGTI